MGKPSPAGGLFSRSMRWHRACTTGLNVELQESSGPVCRAEIAFDPFPCERCATEADLLLRNLDGIILTSFNPSVERLAVLFDHTKIQIPRILATMESFGLKPRLISVIAPATRFGFRRREP